MAASLDNLQILKSKIVVELQEEDIPGAKLDLNNLYKYSVPELRFWLQCRGDSLKKCTLKKDIITKIKQYVHTGNYKTIIDPTPDQNWIKLKCKDKKPIITEEKTKQDVASKPEPFHKGIYGKSKLQLNWTKDLKDFPVFTQHEIIEHRNKSGKRKINGESDHPTAKSTGRGEHFQKERYLNADTIFCAIQDKCCYIKAICQASKRANTRYHVSVALDKISGKVKYGHCECPAGKSSYCNHIMALLTELAEYSLLQLKQIPQEISCTSKAREWGIPRALSGNIYKPAIMNMKINKMKVDQLSNRGLGIESTLYEARAGTSRNTDHVAVKKLKSDFCNVDTHIGFGCTITPDNDNTKYLRTKFGPSAVGSVLSYQISLTEHDFKVYCDLSAIAESKPDFEIENFPPFPIQEIPVYGYIDETTLSPQKVDILKTIKITQEQAQSLEKATRNQAENDLWKKERKLRLTASNIGRVCIRKAQFDNLAKDIYNPPPFNEYVQRKLDHGKFYEKVAQQKYTNYLRNLGRAITVSDSGFVVDPGNFWLGCSPDGKVTDYMVQSSYGLCEIKCPHDKREVDLLVASEMPNFFLFNDNGQPKLKHHHVYYYQIQSQMALTGTEWVDFVVYTFKSMVIQRITFDDDFWSICADKLLHFYTKYYINALVAS